MKSESPSSSKESSAELTQAVADFITSVSKSSISNADAMKQFAEAFITHAGQFLRMSQVLCGLLRHLLFLAGFNTALLVWLVIWPLFAKPAPVEFRSYDANPIRHFEAPAERPYEVHRPLDVRNVT